MAVFLSALDQLLCRSWHELPPKHNYYFALSAKPSFVTKQILPPRPILPYLPYLPVLPALPVLLNRKRFRLKLDRKTNERARLIRAILVVRGQHFVAERGPRSVAAANERRASLVYKCRRLLRKRASTKRTFAERKATINTHFVGIDCCKNAIKSANS